jgi:hypothetical protein
MFLLGCMVTIFFFAGLFVQQVLGYSALRTGLAYVPLALTVGVGAVPSCRCRSLPRSAPGTRTPG